jgi:acyl-coenzyme A thioesterase PaaI-like protein
LSGKGCEKGLKKSERRSALVKFIQENPFATDEQLAAQFGVSVATIRLDRNVLRIPEVRERIRLVASHGQDHVRSLQEEELIGKLAELQLNRYALSELAVSPIHVFARTGIMRGHYLVAQVNSLAVALMDADVAVTSKMELKFYRPVRLGEILRARIDVIGKRGNAVKCSAMSEVDDRLVLDGVIWVHTNPAGVSKALEEDVLW